MYTAYRRSFIASSSRIANEDAVRAVTVRWFVPLGGTARILRPGLKSSLRMTISIMVSDRRFFRCGRTADPSTPAGNRSPPALRMTIHKGLRVLAQDDNSQRAARCAQAGSFRVTILVGYPAPAGEPEILRLRRATAARLRSG